MKNNKSRNRILLITGAIAGAAAAYYLTTPKGKKLTKDVIEKGKELQGQFSEKSKSVMSDIKVAADDAMNKANSTMSTLGDKISESKKYVVESMEETISNLKKDAKEAKEKLNDNITV